MGPGRIFDACVPGGCAFSHPLPKWHFTTENHIFVSVDKFWPNFSFILRFAANFSIFLTILAFSSQKWAKITTFAEHCLQVCYIPQKKAKIFWKLISYQKSIIYVRKNGKKDDFLIFDPKMRQIRHFCRKISQNFY